MCRISTLWGNPLSTKYLVIEIICTSALYISICVAGSSARAPRRHGLHGLRGQDRHGPAGGRRNRTHGVPPPAGPKGHLVLVRLQPRGHEPGRSGPALVQAGGEQGPGQRRPPPPQGRRRRLHDQGVQPRPGGLRSLLHHPGEGRSRTNNQGKHLGKYHGNIIRWVPICICLREG